MPEGPECRHYADKLSASYAGLELQSVRILSGRYSKKMIEGFTKFTFPKKLEAVKTKGKFIFFEFEVPGSHVGTYIWNTLGLTGGWTEDSHSHNRIAFNFEGTRTLYYHDLRNFGTFKFAMGWMDTQCKLETLGIDMLQCEYDEKVSLQIFKMSRNAKRSLAEILMNQENYAGVGNYIKAEALYRARLSPHRLGNSLSEDEIRLLHRSVYAVMNEAYQSKLNYWDAINDGEKFKKVIYSEAVAPCGAAIIAETTKDKRTTWWAPTVQK